jgi:hypothetical protein
MLDIKIELIFIIHYFKKMLFPLKLCGAWTLIYTNNHGMRINSKMAIDYNRVKFSPLSKVGPIDVTKNIYGVVGVSDVDKEKARIVWLQNVDYEIDTRILPIIQIPYQERMCVRTHVDYKLEDSCLTINDGIYDYVFSRDFSSKNNESLIKIFITQLLFDYIIRHL